MATKGYIKLDFDWREDDKTMLFEERYGAKNVLDWIEIMCLMGEFGGQIDMKNDSQALKVRKKLRKSEKKVLELFDRLAECGLINREWWEVFRRVGSERSLKDGKARAMRREYALEASEAAKEKRDRERGDGK